MTMTASPTSRMVTRRQREALTLIALGHTNKSMADRMGVAPATAVRHRQEAMRAIGAHCVAQVIHHVVSAGWISIAEIGQSAFVIEN